MKFKQGDTFDYTSRQPVQITDQNGFPIDITDWTVASNILFPDMNRTVVLTASWVNNFVRLLGENTQDWPVGPADIDIEFTSPSGEVVSSSTARFQIIRDVTNAD